MRHLLATALESWARLLRGGVRPCPACDGIRTRRNNASRVPGAMLCDGCGCRWCP
jgi:hypothetical protein